RWFRSSVDDSSEISFPNVRTLGPWLDRDWSVRGAGAVSRRRPRLTPNLRSACGGIMAGRRQINADWAGAPGQDGPERRGRASEAAPHAHATGLPHLCHTRRVGYDPGGWSDGASRGAEDPGG